MFGGLELKAPAQAPTNEPEKDESLPAASGFSFLASPTPAEPANLNGKYVASSENDVGAPAQSSGPSVGSSGFSFLATSVVAEVEAADTTGSSAEADDPVTEARRGISAASTSSFNFMSTAPASAITETKPLETSTDPALTTNSSGFNFLMSATAPKEQPAPLSPKPMQVLPAVNPTEDTNSSASLFSMLSKTVGKSADSHSTAISMSDAPSTNVTMMNTITDQSSWGASSQTRVDSVPAAPSSFRPSTSSLSSSSLASFGKSQPAGSGLNFGGATSKAKPTIKKRARQKKIGAGNVEVLQTQMTSSSVPNPIPVTSTATPMDTINPVETGDALGKDERTHQPPSSSFSKLSMEAQDASQRAEEFLREKQSLSPQHEHTTTHAHTGRYMGHDPSKSDIEEDYGDLGTDSGSTSTSRTGGGFQPPQVPARSQEDDAYLQAKAAAEGAAKQSHPLKQSGTSDRTFSEMIGGFFKRNTNNPPRASPTPELASLPELEKTREKVGTVGTVSTFETNGGNQARLNTNERTNQYELDQKETETEEQDVRQRTYEAEIVKQQERQKELDAQLEQEQRQRQTELEEERMRELKEEEDRIRIEIEEEKRKTPSVMLQSLLKDFAERSRCAVESIASVRKEKTQLNKKKYDAEKQEKLATQQIAHAEKQQLHAADQEDFELADHLASAIVRHQREKEEHGRILMNIEDLIDVLDSKGLDVVREVSDVFIDIQKLLREFLSEQEEHGTKDVSDILDKFEIDTKRLSAENERLTADLKNIERDEDFVAEERRELEENISELTAGTETQRDEARCKLEDINNDIVELRRQLEAKEMEAAAIKMQVHGYDEAIEQVRSKFSRQLIRLEKKEVAAEESRNEWDVEKAAYENMKDEHESKVTAHSEALVAHDNLTDQVKEEMMLAETLANTIGREVFVRNIGIEGLRNDELYKIQAQVVQCEVKADEAKQIYTAAKISIDSLKEKISQILVRIPILEAEKKAAAKRRDFKTATKAKTDLKETISQKERFELELSDEAFTRQETAHREMEKCLEMLEGTKRLAQQKESEGAKKRMVELANKIVKLEKNIEDICGTSQEDCDVCSVKMVGRYVLETEIATLASEGQDLGEKYGGWEDVVNGLDDDFSDSVENCNGQSKGQSEDQNESTSCDNSVCEDQVTETGKESLAGIDEGAPPISGSELSKESIKMCRELLEQVKDAECKLEKAIEIEDYEEASSLDDNLQMLKVAIKSLGLTDEEKAMVEQSYDEESPVLTDEGEAMVDQSDDEESPVIRKNEQYHEGIDNYLSDSSKVSDQRTKNCGGIEESEGGKLRSGCTDISDSGAESAQSTEPSYDIIDKCDKPDEQLERDEIEDEQLSYDSDTRKAEREIDASYDSDLSL